MPPPLPALSALLLVAGAAGFSDLLVHKLRPEPVTQERAAVYVLVLAALGAIVHALALLHLATLPVLRILAGVIAFSGCITMVRRASAAVRLLQSARRLLQQTSFVHRLALLAVAFSLLALLLAALGPVTDPDSLDYHLGIPVEWLRHSGVISPPNWMTARLTGLGEAINMLGLAAGTDCLGAVIQVSGLLALITVFGNLANSPEDRVLVLLVALPPVVLSLAITQKPELFPAAVIVIAMILARTAATTWDFSLIFGCVAFAVSCKYSFLVSGGVVCLFALYRARQQRAFRAAVLCAGVAMSLLVGPVMLRNLYLYGDPVSPFLETFSQHPSADVVAFATSLQDSAEPHTIAGVLRFFRDLAFPASFGEIQTVLGLGLFGLLLLIPKRSVGPLGGFVVVLLFTIWRGQLAPRYLLESYLWCAPGVIAAPWSRLKSMLFYGLTAQTVGVAACAAYAAVALFPGALTPGLRDIVMRRSTFGYQEALWMNRVLPQNVGIMSDSRVYALSPRPFTISRFGYSPYPVNGTMVVDYPFAAPFPDNCSYDVISGPERFEYATRNPFNRREYKAIALQMNCKR